MHAIEWENPGVLAIRLTGRTTVSDYEATVPAVESEIDKGRTLRVIWDICALEAVEPQVIWSDVVFDTRHRIDAGRIAIICRKAWEKWATRMFRPELAVKVRCFRSHERELAERWVREG